LDLKTALINLQCEMVAERTLVNPKHISWLQYDILFQLSKEKEILPSELSVILGVSRAKLSKALKELKASGYIKQSPNPEDGRELRTSISNDGKQLLNNISAKHTALYQTALKVMTNEEQAEFARLSEKLSDALKEERIARHE
jgi:MarR family transcriptional repressor of emrRAB